MNRAILDADVIAYVASQTAKETVDVWGEGTTSSPLEDAYSRADRMVLEWRDSAIAHEVKLAFSGPSANNFRRGVHPTYKSNRTGEKPEYYYEVVEYLRNTYESETHSCLEGDDILGMHMGEGWTAVSTDKDLRTVPGEFVRIRVNGEAVTYSTTEKEADHFWMVQTLTGDTVDGYKGCPGCGVKGAEKVLPYAGGLAALWDSVVLRYEQAYRKPNLRKKFLTGHPPTEALINARAARILRLGEYDVDSGVVDIWTPR